MEHKNDTAQARPAPPQDETGITERTEFYLVRRRAVPEVLRKVVEVNRLLALGKAKTVNEAVCMAGISRSSYYKFKDDVLEFHDSFGETTMTLLLEVADEKGLLARILQIVAAGGANVLTIHQSVPQNGVASVSISLRISRDMKGSGDVNRMIGELEEQDGVRKVSVAGR